MEMEGTTSSARLARHQHRSDLLSVSVFLVRRPDDTAAVDRSLTSRSTAVAFFLLVDRRSPLIHANCHVYFVAPCYKHHGAVFHPRQCLG